MVVVARVKSGVLGFFGLRGSNLLESCLLVSLGMNVTVLMSSLLSSAVSKVLVSLSKMDFHRLVYQEVGDSTVLLGWYQFVWL